MDMADPHIGMVSFQEALLNNALQIGPVKGHNDLYSHIDQPEPGTVRLTYARLSKDMKEVQSFVCCIINGSVNGYPCVAVGYAVPEALRNKGYAKRILEDVVHDQVYQAGLNGFKELYIEAVIDIANIPSQKVAESILFGSQDHINDKASGRPAVRYTAHFDTKTGDRITIG